MTLDMLEKLPERSAIHECGIHNVYTAISE